MDTKIKSRSILINSSFSEILALAFIVLKLTNNIDWSWWWVLSPLWAATVVLAIPVAFQSVLFLIKD